VAQLAGLDQIAEAVVTKLNAAKQATAPASGQAKMVFHVTWRSRCAILPARNGCGKSIGGDRSRAVWFVINALVERDKSGDEIVEVLVDPNHDISAHVL
jgi:hypothetical protein